MMSTRFSNKRIFLSALSTICAVAVLGFSAGVATAQTNNVSSVGIIVKKRPGPTYIIAQPGDQLNSLEPGIYEVSQPGKAIVVLTVEKGMTLVLPADGKQPNVQRVRPWFPRS